jgi:signal transduction histidine kinase
VTFDEIRASEEALITTKRALRRVERMRSEVELISQESLDRRLPLVDADDGIDKLAITMNDMLERLERSNDQQQQFLADASHELRSPVAGLLAQLEVAAAYPDRVDATELIPKLRGEAERLQLLVNDLMFLSRSEAGESAALSPAAVDIDEILSAEVEHQRVVQNDIDISITEPSDATVAGNRRDLERALRNLADNAVRHAARSVRIGSERRGSEVVLTVVDDGQGVPDDQAEHIFERFVRLDEARGRDSGGSGLGLAITREIARKHGGDAALVPTAAGSRFELVLPVA